MNNFIRNIYYFALKCWNWFIPHFKKVIYVGEYVTDRNFGDALNFVLLPAITHRKLIPKRYCFSFQYEENENVLFIGSIIRTSTNQSIVWGAGAISHNDEVKGVKEILSVRGPLTRDILCKQGYNCPPVYGDPALALPLFYKPHSKNGGGGGKKDRFYPTLFGQR